MWPESPRRLTCTLLIGQESEMTLRMTPAMGAIYDAITDLMDACLKELKRSNKVRRACGHVPLCVSCGRGPNFCLGRPAVGQQAQGCRHAKLESSERSATSSVFTV